MNIDLASFISSIDFSNPTWDMFIILFFIIGAFLYGFSLGRDRIIVILVSIYMSLAVVSHIPLLGDMAQVTIGDEFVFKLTSFFVLFLFLFFLFARSGLLNTIAVGDNSGRWYHVFFFSILHIGLLLSIALSFLPRVYLDHFSLLTQQIFVSELAQFVWIIAPIIAMAMIRRRSKDK